MNRLAFVFRLACVALCAACLPPFARAATLSVPAQYVTIQAAVTAANAGDTILVADGTYTGAGNLSIDFSGKDLIVKSASGNPANCVIDCQQASRAFYLHNNETMNSLIQGFTIKNGRAGYGFDSNGGGIYINTSGSSVPNVANCVFTGNFASGYHGGGMIVGGAGGGMSGGTATNCAFNGNGADAYGGGMAYGAALNCSFDSNTGSYPSGSGGGMAWGMASNCVFTNNSAGENGGGIYQGNAVNCVFTGNFADGIGGGGMYAGAATDCVFTGNGGGVGGGMWRGTVTRCLFTFNRAAVGGGMASSTATNSSFIGNIVSQSGGGISGGSATNCLIFNNSSGMDGGGVDEPSALYFCTIVNNHAARTGGGVSFTNILYQQTSQTVSNCIVWGNHADGGSPNATDYGFIYASDIEGGYNGDNINADPLFVNQSAGNLHLTAASPCINAAYPYPFNGAVFPATDLDGGNRTVGAAPDMGAYEYGNVGVFGTLAFAGIAANAPAQNVTFQFRPVGGGATINQTCFTTSDGAFYLYGVPDGNYNLWIKSPTYLAKVVPVTVSGGVASIAATLQPGDCNNDNFCDATDFGIFVSAYNSSASVPGSGYDPTADLNGDGSVDATDFGLFVGSYNTQGAP